MYQILDITLNTRKYLKIGSLQWYQVIRVRVRVRVIVRVMVRVMVKVRVRVRVKVRVRVSSGLIEVYGTTM